MRLFVALGHNRGDFRWEAPGNRPLVDRHLMWCLDQRKRGWLMRTRVDGTVPPDNLTIFATTSRGELDQVLAADPLVVAGVRHYAVSGCHARPEVVVSSTVDDHG